MKIDGLPEASTIRRMSGDRSISSTTDANSVITSDENLLIFSPGRSNQMTARSPSRSMRNALVIATVPSEVWRRAPPPAALMSSSPFRFPLVLDVLVHVHLVDD